MKDGYYWAKFRFGEYDWEIVGVQEQVVYTVFEDYSDDPDNYEFGDRIEIPEKYE